MVSVKGQILRSVTRIVAEIVPGEIEGIDWIMKRIWRSWGLRRCSAPAAWASPALRSERHLH